MSQRAALAAGAVAAAAAWLLRRTKRDDEKRERAGSIAYDTKDELFHAMRKDAITAAAREPWMAGTPPELVNVANVAFLEAAHPTGKTDEFRVYFGGADTDNTYVGGGGSAGRENADVCNYVCIFSHLPEALMGGLEESYVERFMANGALKALSERIVLVDPAVAEPEDEAAAEAAAEARDRREEGGGDDRGDAE